MACFVAPRRRRFKLATIKVMSPVTVLEELPTSFNVGSHDLDDGISYFSNFGSCVDAYTSRGEYSDEVLKEAEAAAVEGEAVDFPEVDAEVEG